MKTLIAFTLACGIALAQTPAAKKAAPAAAPAPAAAQGKAAPAPAAKKAAAPAPNLLQPNTLKAKAPEEYRVKFTTTKGDIVLDIHRAWAPLGAERFYNLVRAGFFKDVSFFRVIPRFVAQFGISPNPAIAAAWEGARIVDDRVIQSNKRGTIVFATAGPNTRTTQFFINFSDNAALDGQGFAPFGQVSEGMDIVDKIYAGYAERPDQGRIQAEGKAYLDRYFPMLDRILSAAIVPIPPPAAADDKKNDEKKQ
jgi:peptidyl-prolyl cis-trans isomerase A (cyclophilin A)